MVIILDYGLGNLNSVFNMILRIRQDVKISSDPILIRACSHLIIPGVGSFDYGIGNLEKSELLPLLHELKEEGRVKILGICLGFQLMCLSSEEGICNGLGWIPIAVRRFPIEKNRSAYNMSWLSIAEFSSGFEIFEKDRFYFTHGFYVPVLENSIFVSQFYSTNLTAFYRSDNIFGVQFHPEKSSIYGLNFLKYFFNEI